MVTFAFRLGAAPPDTLFSMRFFSRVRTVAADQEPEQAMDPARALLEYGELVALVLDGEGKLVESSSRARELFPALELGKVVPEAVELANARRIRYEQGTERRTLVVAPLVDQAAYEELRVGFTAAVSHELRTPLARIRLLVEIGRQAVAAQGQGEPSDPRTLDEIEREAIEIDALVGELLASARIEFQAVTPKPLDAVEVARRALERAG